MNNIHSVDTLAINLFRLGPAYQITSLPDFHNCMEHDFSIEQTNCDESFTPESTITASLFTSWKAVVLARRPPLIN